MMMGAVVKGYFSTVAGVQPEDICSVSVMPCVRKQGEADREWFVTDVVAKEACGSTVRDVDHVMTTAELGKILVERGIDLAVRGWASRGGKEPGW
jgi:iron only hydrogenase large subunit-like protein